MGEFNGIIIPLNPLLIHQLLLLLFRQLLLLLIRQLLPLLIRQLLPLLIRQLLPLLRCQLVLLFLHQLLLPFHHPLELLLLLLLQKGATLSTTKIVFLLAMTVFPVSRSGFLTGPRMTVSPWGENVPLTSLLAANQPNVWVTTT